QSTCSLRGCCWSPQSDTSVPWCFFSPNHGYKVQGSQRATPAGKLRAGPPNFPPHRGPMPHKHLLLVSPGFEATLKRLPSPSLFGKDIQKVLLTAEYQTPNRFRFKITDPKTQRFEVPHEHVRPFTGPAASGLAYKVEL
ncbi:MGA protein, partial [Vireo altiloquus]|nr:MGA protein [Vireo altiloquus]